MNADQIRKLRANAFDSICEDMRLVDAASVLSPAFYTNLKAKFDFHRACFFEARDTDMELENAWLKNGILEALGKLDGIRSDDAINTQFRDEAIDLLQAALPESPAD